MSPAAVERGVAARADWRSYTGGPSLPTFESSFATAPQDPQVESHISIGAMRKRRQSLVYAEFTRIIRQSWKTQKPGSKPKPRSEGFVYERLETTGRASHQVLDLVGELAAPPRPSSAVFGRSADTPIETPADRDDAGSFQSASGGRVRFADIELSSDEDLIEAGYRFFSQAEDPELAAESRRRFLERLGLGPE